MRTLFFQPANKFARVKNHAGRRDHRIPVVDRLLHAVPLGAFADLRARVVDAVGDDRPAVVLARLRWFELVAAARAVLHRPQLRRSRGSRAAAWMLRWPYDQISGRAPARPTNGLSLGTEPSALIRTTLPIVAPRSWASSR